MGLISVGNFDYFDPVKNWPRIERHLSDPLLNRLLVEGFNSYTMRFFDREFTGGLPGDWETFAPLLGDRRHSYLGYVKHEACFALVNFALRLAMLVEPAQPWRILGSNEHATVWDGSRTLFDFQYYALGLQPWQAFERASGPNGVIHPMGNFASPWLVEGLRVTRRIAGDRVKIEEIYRDEQGDTRMRKLLTLVDSDEYEAAARQRLCDPCARKRAMANAVAAGNGWDPREP
jgi:hypothetical protein